MNTLASRKAALNAGLFDEIIVDNFAGGGGASMGIEAAMGRCRTSELETTLDGIGYHCPNKQGNPCAYKEQIWRLSNRFSRAALPIANRHYNRQTPDSPQFVPPGRCVVLLAETASGKALWVSSWPRYAQHAWEGGWINTVFRIEGAWLSSDLITLAVAATLAEWGLPPAIGFVTFVNAEKVRRKRDPGRCYRKAGWRHVGHTKGGLLAFQLLPAEMPNPLPAIGHQMPLAIGGQR